MLRRPSPSPDLRPVRGAGGVCVGRLLARRAQRQRHLLAYPRRRMDAGARPGAARRSFLLHRRQRALAHPGMAGRDPDGAGLAGRMARGVYLLFASAAALDRGHRRPSSCASALEFVPALADGGAGPVAASPAACLARPHLLTLPAAGALWTAGLVRAREKDQIPSLLLLLVIPLWANLHGSFAFGLALAGAFRHRSAGGDAACQRRAILWVLFLAAATAVGVADALRPGRTAVPPQDDGRCRAWAISAKWQPSDFAKLSPFAIALLAALFVFGSGKVQRSAHAAGHAAGAASGWRSRHAATRCCWVSSRRCCWRPSLAQVWWAREARGQSAVRRPGGVSAGHPRW